MGKKLEITQAKSAIDRVFTQKRTIRALGLHKLHQTVVHADTASIRGMIDKVKHLVVVKEVDGE
jgi:large subunit ribosomal protein L30